MARLPSPAAAAHRAASAIARFAAARFAIARFVLAGCALACVGLAGASAAEVVVPDGPVARIGDQVVKGADLGGEVRDRLTALRREHDRHLKEFELKYQASEYDAVQSAVDKTVDERVLALEAKAHGSTPAALLAALKVPPVTSAEARVTYDKYAAQIQKPFAEVEQPLIAQMKGEREEAARTDYLRELRARHGAVVLLEPLRLPVKAEGPTRGRADAPITVVLFADFECGYCAQLAPTLARILKTYPEDVRLVYRHLPLASIHPEAMGAATAAVCADRQGKFWEFYDAAYADKLKLDSQALRRFVVGAGADERSYDDCMARGHPERTIEADLAAADDLGLSSTPAFLINGQLVLGNRSFESLVPLFDAERARLTAAPPRS